MNKKYIFIFLLCINNYLHGQINIGGKPYSFEKKIIAKKVEINKTPKINIPKLDIDKLKKEDRINDSLGKPFRYGYVIDVNYDLDNSGEWIILENGDRIWKLSVYCPLTT